VVGIDFGYGPFHDAKDRYAAYRKRMVEAALRGYAMDVTTTNDARVHQYLEDGTDRLTGASLPPPRVTSF